MSANYLNLLYQARCPVCQAGPLTSQEVLDVSRGISSKKVVAAKNKLFPPKPQPKKVNYTSAPSSDEAGSSSQATEVLTIIDTSDEESDEEPVPVPKKSNGKGKAKRFPEDDDSDYARTDAKIGDLSSDDEPAAKGEKKPLMGSRDDFKSSTKLDALIKSLQAVREEDPTVKVVVFSQFTGFRTSTSALHPVVFPIVDTKTGCSVDIIERGLTIEGFK